MGEGLREYIQKGIFVFGGYQSGAVKKIFTVIGDLIVEHDHLAAFKDLCVVVVACGDKREGISLGYKIIIA